MREKGGDGRGKAPLLESERVEMTAGVGKLSVRSWGEILEGNSGYNFQVKLTVLTSSYVFPGWSSSCA